MHLYNYNESDGTKEKYMKKNYCLQGIFFMFLLMTSTVYANDFWDRFSFSLMPKIPTDDGSFSEFGFGYQFTDRFASEIRLNINEKRLNERFGNIDNSLNAVINSEWRWFAVPLRYSFLRDSNMHLSAGFGLFYYRQNLEENGYFNASFLNPPVNAYTNSFSMNVVGPLLEADFSYVFSDFFIIRTKADLVPFGLLSASQRVNIIPLFDNNLHGAFSHSQESSNAQFFQGRLTMDFYNLIAVSGIYSGSFHKFDAVDFDSDYNVFTSSKMSASHSFRIEGSVYYDFEHFTVSTGIGGLFNSVYLGSSLATKSSRFYFIFGVNRTVW